jgi:CO dehydrogenase maturation factor
MPPKIIAVAGKGGVGKTSVSAAMVRILTEQRPNARILAIDADPAIGLSTALGVGVTKTLDDIRKEIVAKTVSGETREAVDLLHEARFHVFEAMAENAKFAFLAIGRPETAGCYCGVNAYLKEVIAALADEFDYVVIDGEAGIEQINRRVMEKVTHLLLVSDQSQKGVSVLRNIIALSADLIHPERTGAVLNRVENADWNQFVDLGDIELLATIAPDEAQLQNDIRGLSVFELPEGSALLNGAERALLQMNFI